MKALVKQYVKLLKIEGDLDETYKWDAISHFQETWNIEAHDFEVMFINAFSKVENLLYQNSWGFISKAVTHFPEKVRVIFRDLYTEDIELETRIKTFQKAAKILLPQVKNATEKDKLSTRQDERTISVYLSFRYPEKYYLYKSSFYKKLCEKRNVPPEKPGKRFLHYLELAESIKQKYISNNKILKEIHEEIYPETSWMDDNLITQNFLYNMLEKRSSSSKKANKNTSIMEFFTQREFDLLKETGKKKNNKKDKTLSAAYTDLKNAYEKVEYWMEELQRRVFPAGKVHIFKRPTNQANNFDGYLWGKIYPTEEDLESKWLAFTVGLDGSNHFNVKIDTVGLDDKDKLRQDYFKYRGDYYNSKIVNRYSFRDVDNWNDLLENSEEDLHELLKYWDELKSLKEGGMTNETAEEYKPLGKPPLNQILYGPPGTGKTYRLKENYFSKYTLKEASITKEAFFEETLRDLTWWQVIAMALLELGTSKVSDILENRWVAGKTSLSESKNVRATLWGNLQMHTVHESTTVAYTQRQVPLIFDKNEDKSWSLLENELQEQFPELYDILESVNNFKANPQKEIKHYVFTTFHQSFSYEDFIEGIKPKLNTEASDVELSYQIENGVFKELCLRAQSDPENRYAIFIDEINRGNVSAIFGELITLIEADKRLGAQNEMKVRLPYSKTDFGVPSNVDIYGTMNTADRSVEALDTALRRRFSFKEIMPDPLLLEDIEFEGFNLKEVLETINERIDFLLDRDHTIGHSYFMNLESDDTYGLEEVFKNKVIPLLQEYFYHDYEKIALILGPGFVNVKMNHEVMFPSFEGITSPDQVTLCELINDIDDIEDAVLKLLNKDGE